MIGEIKSKNFVGKLEYLLEVCFNQLRTRLMGESSAGQIKRQS